MALGLQEECKGGQASGEEVLQGAGSTGGAMAGT